MKPSDFLFVRTGICLFCRYEETEGDVICFDCRARLMPSGDDFLYDDTHRCRIAYFYNRAMQALLRRFKFEEGMELAEPLGALLAEFVQAGCFEDITHIQPVPMHPRAIRQRGYNQSELLAKALAAHTGWTVADLLVKRRHTPEQNKMNRMQREHNLKDAFTAACVADAGSIRLLLIDDFVTTGNTMKQATRALAPLGLGAIRGLALTAPRRYPGR